jgi:hypothetical protein
MSQAVAEMDHNHLAVKAALRWSGWGSPIGASVFLVSVRFLPRVPVLGGHSSLKARGGRRAGVLPYCGP